MLFLNVDIQSTAPVPLQSAEALTSSLPATLLSLVSSRNILRVQVVTGDEAVLIAEQRHYNLLVTIAASWTHVADHSS